MSGRCEACGVLWGLAEVAAVAAAVVVAAEPALATITAVSAIASAVGAGATGRRAGVRADVDRLAGDYDVLHLVDVARGEV